MEKEVLTKLGLTSEEADIYLSLLNFGSQTAIQISKNTKVKRTYVYKIIQGLILKNLAIKTQKDKTTVFSPLGPDHLLSLASQKKQEAELAEKSLENIINSLKSFYVASQDKPVVTIYEGIDGIKKIYEETIKESQTIYAVLQTSEVEPTLRDWLKNSYSKRRSDQGIEAKVILSSGKLSAEYNSRNAQTKREVREVPNAKFPFTHEIDIFGSKIAFINYKKGEPLIGVLIDHKQISTTMKAWFDLAWIGAEKFIS